MEHESALRSLGERYVDIIHFCRKCQDEVIEKYT